MVQRCGQLCDRDSSFSVGASRAALRDYESAHDFRMYR